MMTSCALFDLDNTISLSFANERVSLGSSEAFQWRCFGRFHAGPRSARSELELDSKIFSLLCASDMSGDFAPPDTSDAPFPAAQT